MHQSREKWSRQTARWSRRRKRSTPTPMRTGSIDSSQGIRPISENCSTPRPIPSSSPRSERLTMKMNELNKLSDRRARPARRTLAELEQHRSFVDRHIGTDEVDQAEMLEALGFPSRAALIDAIVPSSIRSRRPLALPPAKGEQEALDE